MTEKNLISLKEAAKESGYSADYIGQLIRAGKIPGKQVYSNITWMTTADAVLDYKNASKTKQSHPSVADKLLTSQRKLAMEIGILKLVFQNFKSALSLTIITLLLFSALVYSIFYFSSDRSSQDNPSKNNNVKSQELLF